MAGSGEAGEGELAAFYEHVEANGYAGDCRKGDGKDGEGRQEFAEEIELRSGDDGEEAPQPGAAAIARSHWRRAALRQSAAGMWCCDASRYSFRQCWEVRCCKAGCHLGLLIF